MQSSAPGEEQSQAHEDVGGHSAGKQTGRERPGVLVDTKLSMSQQYALCHKGEQQSPWLYYTKYHKQVKRGNCFPLLSIAKAVHVCNSGLPSATKV